MLSEFSYCSCHVKSSKIKMMIFNYKRRKKNRKISYPSNRFFNRLSTISLHFSAKNRKMMKGKIYNRVYPGTLYSGWVPENWSCIPGYSAFRHTRVTPLNNYKAAIILYFWTWNWLFRVTKSNLDKLINYTLLNLSRFYLATL